MEEESKKKLAMYVYILPNLMTTGNLFCGFIATLFSVQQNFLYAAYAIVFAAVFDQLDGRVARITHSTSKFGAEYDSLCDLVSFGVAPAVLLYMWALQPFGRLGWLACFLFVACGAIRLARFNVQVNIIEKNYFQGLPIPMAAGIVASSVLAFEDVGIEGWGQISLLLMTLLLALVMVSTFRYRSFKDIDLKERLPFRYLIMGLGILFIVALWPEVMLFALFLIYAVIGAIFGFFKMGINVRRLRKANKAKVIAPLEEDDDDLMIESEED